MRLNALLEVDLSRRQFLKLGSKAAMVAAAPKTALGALKGLSGSGSGSGSTP
jgi:hypothetical protein